MLHSLRFRAGIVVAITFQQVNSSPDTETCAKGYNQCLQYCDRAVEKCHIRVLLLVTGRFSTGLIWFENKNALYLHVHLQKRT